MAIDKLCSVTMVFFTDSIEREIWTGFVAHFHTKFQHMKREVIENLLSLKLPDYSPPLSSFKYIVDVKGIALLFTAHVSQRKLIAH